MPEQMPDREQQGQAALRPGNDPPKDDLPPLRHVIVTGGQGYIGRCVVAMAVARGLRVTILSRHAGGAACVPSGVRHVRWALGEALPAAAIDPAMAPAAQAVIHLAHDWRNAGVETQPGRAAAARAGDGGSGPLAADACEPANGQGDWAASGAGDTAGEGGLNLAGTRALLQACRGAGLGRFVFVSSQSARDDAANIYGRLKARIEKLLDRPGEVSARVGLVYGGDRVAMYGLLFRLAGLAPVLPMIEPARLVQPIHIDEVADGLLRLAARGGGGWTGLAAPNGVPFGDFLRGLARECHGKRLRIVPVSLRLALLGCAVSAKLPFLPTVDRERVLGLAGTRPMACAAQLSALGLAVAPWEQGLRREAASRKALLREGQVLLRYCLGIKPGRASLRLYARAIRAAGESALALPGPLRWMPALVRLIEPVGGGSSLARRLRLASTLAEASAEGERRLAASSRAGRLAVLAGLGVLDALALPFRLAMRR